MITFQYPRTAFLCARSCNIQTVALPYGLSELVLEVLKTRMAADYIGYSGAGFWSTVDAKVVKVQILVNSINGERNRITSTVGEAH